MSIYTPFEIRGFRENDILRTTEYSCLPSNTLVKLAHDDGSSMPRVRVISGPIEGLELWEDVDNLEVFVHTAGEQEMTINASMMGLTKGDKVVVKNKNNGGTHRFETEVSVGDILTFDHDDGSENPFFKMEGGRMVCPNLRNLEKLEGGTSMTPAQEAGIEIGEKVVVNYDDHHAWDKGDVIEFIFDDGSDCPRFRGINGKEHYIFVKDVRKGNTTENTELGELFEAGGHLEEGDVVMIKGDAPSVIIEAGEPDIDGEYRTNNGYVGKSSILSVYRPPKSEQKEETVTVTLELSRSTAIKMSRAGALLEEDEIHDFYSDEFKKALVELAKSMQGLGF